MCITFDKSFGENFVKMIKFSLKVILPAELEFKFIVRTGFWFSGY